MVAAMPSLAKVATPEKVAAKVANFTKGLSDKDLLDKCRVMDPSFSFEARVCRFAT
jgi:hypothetical protein